VTGCRPAERVWHVCGGRGAWDKARAAAERAANAEALSAIADRGIAAALDYADLVESPATRGAVMISIWFDPVDEGNLRRRVSYERAPG
jgi:hypothetical protein